MSTVAPLAVREMQPRCVAFIGQVLEERRRSHPDASAQPRVLFTVPVGHNPTGDIMSCHQQQRATRQ
jgi:DNA-binding transcriptional MocR family regulator